MTLRSVTTWTLEMTSRPAPGQDSPHAGTTRIERVTSLTPEYARWLYAVVGGPWTWTDRLGWSREQWQADLDVPGTETWVVYDGGAPCGFVQLQPTPGTPEGSVEVRYFGLVQEAIGRGLGRRLLRHGIEAAWSLAERHELPPTSRVWLHTCDLDGGAALPNYLARGFHVVDEVTEQLDYPDDPLGAWRSSGGPA